MPQLLGFFWFWPIIFSYAITSTLRASLILLTLLQRKGRGEERVAKLQDSPDCPEREATYVITNGFVFLPGAFPCFIFLY